MTTLNDRQVRFTNRDSVTHTIVSSPHPTHDTGNGLNVGALAAGAARVTATLPKGSCRYHDETRPDDTALQGTVEIR